MESWEVALLVVALVVGAASFASLGIWLLFASRFLGRRTFEKANPVCVQWEDLAAKGIDRTPFVHKLRGQKTIQGFLYSKGDLKGKPLIILSPGYGDTHLQYLFDIRMLVLNGFLVLAYDQYGTGMSSGRSLGYLAKGRKVLDGIIDDVERRSLGQGRRLFLYGHSWGGYCVLSVLAKHPEIAKCVARAPLDNPVLAPLETGKLVLGGFLMDLCKPMAVLSSLVMHGPKAFKSAHGGLSRNDTTRVLITASAKDRIVPLKASPIRYLRRHPQGNVSVVVWPSRIAHNDLVSDESLEGYGAKVRECKELATSADYPRALDGFLGSLDREKAIRVDEKAQDAILGFLRG